MLPSGLSFTSYGNGVLSGTPNQAGTFTATFEVLDSRNQTVQKIFSLIISSISPLPTCPNGGVYCPNTRFTGDDGNQTSCALPLSICCPGSATGICEADKYCLQNSFGQGCCSRYSNGISDGGCNHVQGAGLHVIATGSCVLPKVYCSGGTTPQQFTDPIQCKFSCVPEKQYPPSCGPEGSVCCPGAPTGYCEAGKSCILDHENKSRMCWPK